MVVKFSKSILLWRQLPSFASWPLECIISSVCLNEDIENNKIKIPSTLQIGYNKEIICEKPSPLIRNGRNTAEKLQTYLFLNIFSKDVFKVKQREIKVVKHPAKIMKYASVKKTGLSLTIYRNGISLTKLSEFLCKTKFPSNKKVSKSRVENRLAKKVCFLFKLPPAFDMINPLIEVFNAT